MKALIIGSSRGIQHIDSDESYPMALLKDRRGRRAIDWALSALDKVGIEDVIFIGGYHIEKVILSYPKLKFYYNTEWENGIDLQALYCASIELDGPCVIVRSDVVFHVDALQQLLDTDVDVAIGVESIHSQPNSTTSDAFTGIAVLSKHATDELKRKIESFHEDDCYDTGNMPSLIDAFSELNIPVTIIELGNNYAQIHTPQSLARFVFNTKAQTLERLQPLLKQASILDQCRFTVKEWQDNSEKVLARIQISYPEGLLIIRSSALSEDSWNESQAGYFNSVLGIDARHSESIYKAIESVIESFIANGSNHEFDEVFVQPYLDSVDLSGVLFTRNVQTAAPYIIVNYDNTTKRTDTVTSGKGEDLKTTIIYKQCLPEGITDKHMAHLTTVVQEIEELTGHDSLDIEFAFDKEGNCYILQVRVLVLDKQLSRVDDEDFHQELDLLKNFINEIMKQCPNLLCDRTILSNMPDWNPAEIIGVSPRPLALSLFQYIITDRIWGKARAASGYRDTYPEPLVVALSGHPYVDTRASFNSFIPASLDEKIAEKLVDYYLCRLEAIPEFHDKVEFEIAITCLDFNFAKQRKRLMENGFAEVEVEEIRKSLFLLTDDIICGRVASIEKQMAQVSILAPRREKALRTKPNSPLSFAKTIDFLLSDCMRFGTLPFSIVARYAFIASSFLKSLETVNTFLPEEIGLLQQSIPTVATEILEDFDKLRTGRLSRYKFLIKYGHLRPGTYDIRCPSYNEAPEFYLGNIDKSKLGRCNIHASKEGENLFCEKELIINSLIKKAGFSFSVSELWNFIVSAISAREKAKYEYTKNLSAAISLIAEFGESLGFSADDLSFLSIHEILRLSVGSQSIVARKTMARSIHLNRKNYSLHESVELPHMIISHKDVDCFQLLKWHPNYISSKRITGSVTDIDSIDKTADLQGEIVLIESADPGYDWLFGMGIGGLVTKYGGAASHMAIRAAELSIPAAIGCGDVIYNRILKAQVIEIDCSAQIIRVIR